jgi:hypothetical protein
LMLHVGPAFYPDFHTVSSLRILTSIVQSVGQDVQLNMLISLCTCAVWR